MIELNAAEKALLLASLLFYFSGAVQGVSFLFSARRAEERSDGGVPILLGFLLQTAFIGLRWQHLGSFPPARGRFEGLVFLIWAIILVCLIVQWRNRTVALAAFVMPVVVTLFAGVFLSIDRTVGNTPVFTDTWVYSHVVTAFLAYGTFVLAFVLGVMYLIQERQLRAKKISRLMKRLPPIETLAELAYKAVLIGFPLLTYALVMGGIGAVMKGAERWLLDPKVISAALTWVFYAGLLCGRLADWFSGRKLAYFTIVGFGGVLCTYLLTGFLLGGAHPFQ